MDLMTHTQADEPCCPEFAAMNRRSLLRGALALGGATFMVGSATVSASAASLKQASVGARGAVPARRSGRHVARRAAW